jgi:methylaspartate mutase epsilon subunit
MPKVKPYSILLGGIGGDSHSVGLTILRQALGTTGYEVLYLGIQNRLEKFFELAPWFNLVMMSCIDGHAAHYLHDFPEYRAQVSPGCLWYLGGNLTIGEGFGWERRFREMGFDRVFVKFVDIETVMEWVAKDLHQKDPKIIPSAVRSMINPAQAYLDGPVSESKLPEDDLKKTRGEVLQQWNTGIAAADLDANAEYLSKQPSFPAVQAMAKQKGISIVQPRSGVPLLSEQIEHFNAFKSLGVQALSYQVDSFTRNNNYRGAAEAIKESWQGGSTAVLNGFPVINHGVPGLRQIMSAVGLPMQTRHSTRDPRLLAEVSYAGGVTAFEGGAICYNIPYYKDYPLSESIGRWRYVDRLTGLYHDRYGIVLDREYFGVLTGTLIPPSLAITTCILEALLAVQQGVKCVSLGWAEQGHRPQDLAAIKVIGEMAEDVLDNMGYKDVQVNTVFNQYMAAFPQLPQMAEDLIYNSAVTAGLACPTRILVKTPVEAYKVPTMRDNLQGLMLVMQGVNVSQEEEINAKAVEAEALLIRQEAQQLFDSVIMAGGGNVAKGIVEAFSKGWLDVPFSPSMYNRGEVLTARDREGAVRYANFGSLQMDKDIKQFHSEKMTERRKLEGLKSEKENYLLIERDVLQIARGQYEGWPLAK